MGSDTGDRADGNRRRRAKGKPTTIDLSAEKVRSSKPARDPADSPAPGTTDEPGDEALFADSGPQGEPAGEERPGSPASATPASETSADQGKSGPTEDRSAGPKRADDVGLVTTGTAATSEVDSPPADAPAPPPEPSAGLDPSAEPVTGPVGDAAAAGPLSAGDDTGAAEDRREDRRIDRPHAREDERNSGGTAVPSAVAPERKGSTMGALTAAVIGGVIVLAGGAALIAGGVLSGGSGQADVATAEQVDALQARLDTLSQRVDAQPAAPADIGAQLDQLQAAMPPADLADRVAALGEQVDTLASTQPDAAGTDRQATDLDLDQRLTTLADDVQALRQQVEANAADDLAGRLDGLDTAISEIRTDVSGLNDRIAQLQASLSDASGAADARDARLGEITGRLDTIEQRLDAGPTGGEIAALSLAVTSLSGRVAAGEPFAAELAMLSTAAPNLQGLDALAETADTGVPTVDTLEASFPADAILASRLPGADGNVVDRLFAGAKSLVNYRETGTGVADPTAAAVSAIEKALSSGDLQAARAAAADMPDAAKAAASDWIAALDRRIAADQVVAELTDRILTRLQAPAEGQ